MSTFSHLGCGWTNNDCPPSVDPVSHASPDSQQVIMLHHTITPLFTKAFLPAAIAPQLLLPPPAHPTHPLCPFHSLLCLNLTERSSTPHISSTYFLNLLFCNFTPAMYFIILWSYLCKTFITLLVNAMFLLHTIEQISHRLHISFVLCCGSPINTSFLKICINKTHILSDPFLMSCYKIVEHWN